MERTFSPSGIGQKFTTIANERMLGNDEYADVYFYMYRKYCMPAILCQDMQIIDGICADSLLLK